MKSGQLAGSLSRLNAFSRRGVVQRKAGGVPETLIILEITVSLVMGTGEDTVGN
jgi:hypothetical protein